MAYLSEIKMKKSSKSSNSSKKNNKFEYQSENITKLKQDLINWAVKKRPNQLKNYQKANVMITLRGDYALCRLIFVTMNEKQFHY
jgi:hypothetical protein